MFRLDEFHEELSDAKQTVGGQCHKDDDEGRYIARQHLLSKQLAYSCCFPRCFQLLLLRHSHHVITAKHCCPYLN